MLESFSYLGLFAISFISASLYPLASEAFVVGFLFQGFLPFWVFFIATLGNTLGALSTYLLGFLGKSFILEKYFHKNLLRLEKMNLNFKCFGYAFAFFTFLPLIGDLFALALGLARYNIFKTILFIALGKAFRYGILIVFALYFKE